MTLTSKELLDAGIKPGPLFGKCLQLDSLEAALELVESNKTKKPKRKSIKIKTGSVWAWLCRNPCLVGMLSIEQPSQIASNSERRRWLLQKAVEINNRNDWQPDDPMPFPEQLVFFPNGKRRTTML